jgi:hypothetical protein
MVYVEHDQSHPSLLNQQSLHVLGVYDVMQVFVGDFVWPEYLHYLSQTGVLEAGESVDVFISHSPAF